MLENKRFKAEKLGRLELLDKLGVTGSSPVPPTKYKPKSNQSLRCLPAVGGAA